MKTTTRHAAWIAVLGLALGFASAQSAEVLDGAPNEFPEFLKTHPRMVSAAALAPPVAASQPVPDLAALKAEQSRLLAQVRAEIARLRQGESASTPKASVERRKELEALLREIERRIAVDEDPRTRYIDADSRLSGIFAPYYVRLAGRLEAAAQADFPMHDGTPIYGKGRVTLVVRADGALESVEISSSSGNPEIDRHLLKLVTALGPVEPFDDAMRLAADRVVIATGFEFLKDPRPASGPRN